MLYYVCQVVLHSIQYSNIFTILRPNMYSGTRQTRKVTLQQQHDILHGLISPNGKTPQKYCTIACISPIFISILFGVFAGTNFHTIFRGETIEIIKIIEILIGPENQII